MAYTPCLRPAWPSHLTESGLSSKFRREKIKCKCLSEIWLIVTYGKEMKFTYGNEMKSTESRRCHCAFRGVVSGCVSQAQTHTQRRVAQGLTGHILQPVHSQRPDDFCPQGTHGNQEHRLPPGAWGMRICFSCKHRVASKDPGCLPGKERDRSPSSDARAIRSLHRYCPGPGKRKPASRQLFETSPNQINIRRLCTRNESDWFSSYRGMNPTS